MLIIGIAFFVMSGYFLLSEIYSIKKVENELVVVPKKVNKDTENFRYKILMGILSFVIGLFAIINNIIY